MVTKEVVVEVAVRLTTGRGSGMWLSHPTIASANHIIPNQSGNILALPAKNPKTRKTLDKRFNYLKLIIIYACVVPRIIQPEK